MERTRIHWKKIVMILLIAVSVFLNVKNPVYAVGEYIGWSEQKGDFLFLGKEGTDERFPAFCFNKKLAGPGSLTVAPVHYEKTDGSPAAFGAALYHPSTDAEYNQTLYENLRRMLYNGYPQDASGFSNELRGFGDERKIASYFNEVTSWAVWHFTDGLDPREFRKSVYQIASEDQKRLMDKQYELFDRLIDANQTIQPPNDFEIDLFTTVESDPQGRRYQNLIVTRINQPAPKPPESAFGRSETFFITKAGIRDGIVEPNALDQAKLQLRKGEGLGGEILLDDFSPWQGELEFSGATVDLPQLGMKFGDVMTLIEKEVPAGYKKADPIVFTLTGPDVLGGEWWIEIKQPDGTWKRQEYLDSTNFGDATDTLVMYDEAEKPKYPVEIQKTDKTGQMLAGAEFELYKVGGQTFEKVLTFTTNGQSEALQLEEGDYALVETLPPEDYRKLDGAITFHIDGQGLSLLGPQHPLVGVQGNVINVVNEKIAMIVKHKITFKKQDVYGNALQDAHLTIQKIRDEGQAEDIQDGSWMTDATGEKHIELEDGTYRVTETVAPNGYAAVAVFDFTVLNGTVTLVDPTRTDIQVGADQKTLLITDHSNPVNITVTKTWSNGEAAEGIEAVLYADGQEMTSQPLDAAKQWHAEFTNLESLSTTGTPITYTVKERIIGTTQVYAHGDSMTYNAKKYQVTITDQGNNSFVIDNGFVPEKPKDGFVEVSKTVAGKAGDRQQYFKFTISAKTVKETPVSGKCKVTVKNQDGMQYGQGKDSTLDLADGTINFDTSGKAIFYIRDGQSVQIQIPSDVQIEVTETKENGYQTNLKLEGTVAEDQGDGHVKFYLSPTMGTIGVRYTNTKDVVVPTGISLNVTAFGVVFFVALAGVGLMCLNYIKNIKKTKIRKRR